MGIILARIDDELEKKFRIEVAKRYGGRKGAISKAITEAIIKWLQTE
jgi:hypothetical protein